MFVTTTIDYPENTAISYRDHAHMSSTSFTRMRMPRMHGRPPHWSGLNVIRCSWLMEPSCPKRQPPASSRSWQRYVDAKRTLADAVGARIDGDLHAADLLPARSSSSDRPARSGTTGTADAALDCGPIHALSERACRNFRQQIRAGRFGRRRGHTPHHLRKRFPGSPARLQAVVGVKLEGNGLRRHTRYHAQMVGAVKARVGCPPCRPSTRFLWRSRGTHQNAIARAVRVGYRHGQ
jgi:hypothetical protein